MTVKKAKTKLVPINQWEWFGTAGHYICSTWCRFHLTTVVGPYLISTVGELVHPSNSGGSEAAEAKWLKENWPGADIGCDRKYETMVFNTGERCTEVETCGPGGCGLPVISGHELDFNGYMTRSEARAGHMALCLKWAGLS